MMFIGMDVWMLLFLLLSINVYGGVSGAKILVMTPNLAESMVLYAGRIADVLQQSGHNVVSSKLVDSYRVVVSRRFLFPRCALQISKQTKLGW